MDKAAFVRRPQVFSARRDCERRQANRWKGRDFLSRCVMFFRFDHQLS